MDIYSATLSGFSEKRGVLYGAFLQVVLGSIFLSLCAKVAIPLSPVPLTFQTLGVFLLAIMLGGRRAGLAGLLYLFQASVGLPILASGVADPLWMVGPRAGYLFAFPIAAYVVGMLACKKKDSSLWVMFSIFCGQLVIYSLGVFFLSRFTGFKMGVTLGVLPFLPLAGLKLLMASSMGGLYFHFRKKWSSLSLREREW